MKWMREVFGLAPIGLLGFVLIVSCSDAAVPAAPDRLGGTSDVQVDQPDPDPGDDPMDDTPPTDLPGCAGLESKLDAEGDHNGGSIPGEDFDVLYPFPVTINAGDAVFSATTNEDGSWVRISIDGGLNVGELGYWSLTFASSDGAPLVPNVVYPVDDREIEMPLSVLEVTSDVPSYPAGVEQCGVECGGFEINEIVINQGVVERFVASFDQQCGCDPASFTGCVGFVR